MGFTKLDEGIIYSSVMGEDDSVFRVWIILIAACKSNGISPISSIFIKNITGKTLEEINRCLKILSDPDINSRSKNNEGRRIEIADGGFKIINYQKYRDFSYSDHPEAIKKRKQRDILGHLGTCPNMSGTFRDISGHSASVSLINPERINTSFIAPNVTQIKEYCVERKNEINPEAFFDFYESKGWMVGKNKMKNWKAAVRTWEKRGNIVSKNIQEYGRKVSEL